MRNPYVSPAWPGKLERKIDIFLDGKYFASSNAYKRCKDAISGIKHMHALKDEDNRVSARFST